MSTALLMFPLARSCIFDTTSIATRVFGYGSECSITSFEMARPLELYAARCGVRLAQLNAQHGQREGDHQDAGDDVNRRRPVLHAASVVARDVLHGVGHVLAAELR